MLCGLLSDGSLSWIVDDRYYKEFGFKDDDANENVKFLNAKGFETCCVLRIKYSMAFISKNLHIFEEFTSTQTMRTDGRPNRGIRAITCKTDKKLGI